VAPAPGENFDAAPAPASQHWVKEGKMLKFLRDKVLTCVGMHE
jgi:hypothetical protein